MEQRAEISPARRLAITFTVMSATLMQVLDGTIANVALPHMQAALNATQETVAWVLTSYIVASAVAIPITGWLSARIGRRTLFVGALIGFTLASIACGLAPSLGFMVAARIVQGIAGAFMVPVAQATMLDTYPREKQAQAMTIFAMGTLVGPIAGPVLGGWITESLDWRWVFFINVPFGIVGAIAGYFLLKSPKAERTRLDVTGLALIGTALAAFQLMLDRGAHLDWFDSPEVIIEAGVAIAAFWMFLVYSHGRSRPLFPPAMFADRNFALACVFTFIVMGIMIAGSALQSPLLQQLMGYDALGAGMIAVPRGIAMVIGMVLAGRLADKVVDRRLLIAAGLSLTAVAQFAMAGFNLEIDARPLIWTGLLQGFGTGLVLMPLNLTAFSTMAAHLRTDAAAFYSLCRNLGSSIAISVLTALIARNVQVSHQDLGAHVTAQRLPLLDPTLMGRLGTPTDLLRMADMEVNRQAMMIAYIDDFWLMGWLVVLVLPLVLLLKPARAAPSAHAMALE